jgi:hypothetical protein
MADDNGLAQIDGPNGTFGIRCTGWDPAHIRMYRYSDSTQHFFFSVQWVRNKAAGRHAFVVTDADRQRSYLGYMVVLGDDKDRVMKNIEFFLNTRNPHFPDQLLSDPRDVPTSVSFSWRV